MFDSLQSAFDVRFDAPSSFELDGGIYRSIVPVYSRAQAVADGMLVDVSSLAREIGFKDAVALTRQVYADCVADSLDDACKDIEDTQLLSVLLPAVWAMREQSHRRLCEIVFTVRRISPDGRERSIDLKIIAGPGDHGETVLTILTVDED